MPNLSQEQINSIISAILNEADGFKIRPVIKSHNTVMIDRHQLEEILKKHIVADKQDNMPKFNGGDRVMVKSVEMWPFVPPEIWGHIGTVVRRMHYGVSHVKVDDIDYWINDKALVLFDPNYKKSNKP